AESDQCQVDRIQHQLDRHQDHDGIPAQQNAEYADYEQHGAERQVPVQRDFHAIRLKIVDLTHDAYATRLRASRTAPIVATRSRTPITSKGMAKRVNNSRASTRTLPA